MDKRFPSGFIDNKLDLQTLKMWVQKKLPQTSLPPEANTVRIPVSIIMATKFDPDLRKRLDEIEEQNAKSK